MLRSDALVWPPLATKLLLRGPTLSRPLLHPVTRVAIRVPFPQRLTACLSSAVRSRVSRLCLVHSYICIQPIFTMAALSSVVLQSLVISLNLPIHSLLSFYPPHSLPFVYPYIHFRPFTPTFTSVRLPLHLLPSVYPYIHFRPFTPTFTSIRLLLHSSQPSCTSSYLQPSVQSRPLASSFITGHNGINSCSQADAKRSAQHSFGSHQQGRVGGVGCLGNTEPPHLCPGLRPREDTPACVSVGRREPCPRTRGMQTSPPCIRTREAAATVITETSP